MPPRSSLSRQVLKSGLNASSASFSSPMSAELSGGPSSSASVDYDPEEDFVLPRGSLIFNMIAAKLLPYDTDTDLTCDSANACIFSITANILGSSSTERRKNLIVKIQMENGEDDIVHDAFTTKIVSDAAAELGLQDHFMEYVAAGTVCADQQVRLSPTEGCRMLHPALAIGKVPAAAPFFAQTQVSLRQLDLLFAAMHRMWERTGFIHNDLHVGNILINSRDQQMVVIDYGRTYVDEQKDPNVSFHSFVVNDCGMPVSYAQRVRFTDSMKIPSSEPVNLVASYMTDLAGLVLFLFVNGAEFDDDLRLRWPFRGNYDNIMGEMTVLDVDDADTVYANYRNYQGVREEEEPSYIECAVLWAWVLITGLLEQKTPRGSNRIYRQDLVGYRKVSVSALMKGTEFEFARGGQLAPKLAMDKQLNLTVQSVLSASAFPVGDAVLARVRRDPRQSGGRTPSLSPAFSRTRVLSAPARKHIRSAYRRRSTYHSKYGEERLLTLSEKILRFGQENGGTLWKAYHDAAV